MVLPWGIRLLPIAVLVLATAACGSSQDRAAREVADRFEAAVADRDGRTACALLAPETLAELEQSAREPCVEAVVGEGLPGVRDLEQVRVFGTMAQVRYGDETLFLARFPEGWKVMAAGCAPEPADRYDCQVEGG
jgi:hypothetical protein